LLVVFVTRLPLWVAAMVVGAFAIFHVHAHGTELPNAVSPLAYSIGFVISTGWLHLAGIAFGEVIRLPKGDWILRAGGGIIALAGICFLTGAL